jgi:hypothetical protein
MMDGMLLHNQEQNWKLPTEKVPFPSSHIKDRLKHFARLLLEGEVCVKLKPFRAHFATKPSTVIIPTTNSKVLLPLLPTYHVAPTQTNSISYCIE